MILDSILAKYVPFECPSKKGKGKKKKKKINLRSKPQGAEHPSLEIQTTFTLREAGRTAPQAELGLMERELMEEPYYLQLKYNPEHDIHGVKGYCRTVIIQGRCSGAVGVGRTRQQRRALEGRLGTAQQIRPTFNSRNPPSGTPNTHFSAHQVFTIYL